ncbi:AlpA family phage regulatory protein [Nitrosomonas sp.]|uniref:helix-turn-helix transcriptional regulator n=1 Tax=Nitrosomonas sp. TaxID=42353 RepID=UPI00283E4EE9|nr:AlpA family phage regulatory protein [Nitrosomonas sp.]MDR4514910.1 AlpA family transcriptional regulator [Nitrosomonas sp.]
MNPNGKEKKVNQANLSALQQPLQPTLSPERLINLDEVEKQTGFKSSYIYSQIQLGKFPKPVKVGAASRWRESEVQSWIIKQINKGA